jgi:serine protease Do
MEENKKYKNNTGLKYVLLSIFCVFLGCAGMYGLIYFFPNTVINTISKVEKQVTVNDNGISDGIEAVYDSVVVIENYQVNKLAGIGSGFIYNEEGLILTNYHVIENATEIKVILTSGDTIQATIVGSDEYADIAIIKIDKQYVKAIAKIGDSSKLKLGDTVFAVGSPMSSSYAGTVTRGILSGKDRMVEVAVGDSTSSDWIMNVMQTDAAINPGNSGGPLCNVSGEVIGVNNMKIVESSVEGIGFAIPIEDAIDWANKLVKGEEIKRSYLGIRMTDLASTSSYYLKREDIEVDESITSGVVITESISDGPCDKAGIKKGDVINKIGDYEVNTVAELRYYLYKYEPGTKVKIEYIRGTDRKSATVTLGVSE